VLRFPSLALIFLTLMKKYVYVFFFLMLCIGSMPLCVFAQPQRLGSIPTDSYNFISAHGNVYFFSGTHLWGSDGTEDGTRMIQELGEKSVEMGERYPDLRRPDLSFGEDRFFFSTRDAQGAYSLWISDGTPEGTQKLTAGWQSITALTMYKGAYYFSLKDEASGTGLYKVEGEGSLSQVAALAARQAVVFNSALYFVAEDMTGNALWKYAGAEAELVVHLPAGSLPNEMLVVDNTLFFSYYSKTGPWSHINTQLWKSDGSPEGTVLVKDFGSSEWWLYEFIAFRDQLYFMHGDTFSSDFWGSDGTPEGTRLIKQNVAFDGVVIKTGVLDTRMYIAATGQGNYIRIWYSDGTTEGTHSFWLNESGSSVEHVGTYLFYTDVDGPMDGIYADNIADASHIFRNGVSLRSLYGEAADLNLVYMLKASGDKLYFSRWLSDEYGSLALYVYEPEAPAPPPASPAAVTGFVLVNADTNEDIMILKEGSLIHMRDMPSNRLNIRAITSPAQTGSVVFTTAGVSEYTSTDNEVPYAYRGDRDGNYHGWVPGPGQYSITATPYTEAAGQGTAGTALTLNFQIVRAAEASFAITGFTLVNADSNQDIMPLTDGAVLKLQELPTRNLNIRASTGPDRVGSVFFSLLGQGNYTRVESDAPFALAGDRNGNYTAWTPAPGSYVLTATPYVSRTARGRAGTPLTIHFEVEDNAPASGASASIAFSAYPNPFSEQVTIDVHALQRTRLLIEVFDMHGTLVQRLLNRQVDNNQSLHLQLDGRSLRKGVYLLRISTDKEVITHRLMLAR
jgi:ELWxxDGT repeat protein